MIFVSSVNNGSRRFNNIKIESAASELTVPEGHFVVPQ